MHYRPDIDGLRTLAVVPVVLYHAGVAGFSGGFVGVDIFFVISGFLITTIIHRELAEGRFSILHFYERRARRILPALFTVMAASLVAGWFLLAPADYEHMGASVLSALLFVSNIWFWETSGGYFDGATDYLPMLHTWSLAVEEQFYIFFPLLLMLLYRVSHRSVLPTILVLVLGSLALAIWATPRMPSASFYLLPTRIWELGFGALLALGVAPARLARPLREGLAAIGLLAVVAPVFVYSSATPFPGLAALAPVTGAALLIWTGGTGPTLTARLLSLRPMVFIGLISYSLYLWHWPIMTFLRNRFFTVDLDPAWQVAAVLASSGVAWLSWRSIERPFRISVRAGGLSQKGIFATAGLGMATGFAIAVTIVATNGAELRFSATRLKDLASLESDLRERPDCFGARPVSHFCRFGAINNNHNGTWLVWGDSHAYSLTPALSDVAKKAGKDLILASKGDCAPLLGIIRTDRPETVNTNCENFKRDVLEMVMRSPAIDTVFLAARWPLYFEGNRLPAEGARKIHFFPTATSDAKDQLEVITQALLEVLKQLRASGKIIVLLGPVPEIPWNVLKHLKGHVLFDRPLRDPVKLEDLHRQKKATSEMQRLAARNGAIYLALDTAICTPSCKTHLGLVSFYRDYDHLTQAGARHLLTNRFEEILLSSKAAEVGGN